jgi:UDP-N-acetyl-2-amino-2-deoxyglucuronate dehydrogenase
LLASRSEEKVVRFCIAGAGFIGGLHAAAIAAIPEARLTVVCSRSESSARALAAKTGAAWTTDCLEAVRREDVDVVCICTPSGAHAELAVASAEAGKHMVVEKPLEITLERVDRIIGAASVAGVKLTCIFPLRFMEGVRLAKEAIAAGRLGRLVLADAYIKWYRDQQYYSSSDWKGTWALDGGGALMNQGIHNIDLLNYLAGPVRSVVARTRTLAHQMQTEDVAAAVLQYANGALGVIEGSTGSWPGDSGRVSLHGDRGTITLDDGRIIVWKLSDAAPGEEQRMLGEASLGSGASSATAIGYEMHRRQLLDMVQAIQQEREPAISGAEARQSVAIIRAIYESSHSGDWVKVS